MRGQGGSQECCRSAYDFLFWIFKTIRLALREQGGSQECCGSAQLWLLRLKDKKIGGEGARRLAGVLPQCPALRRLHLGGNQIGAEVAGRLREA